MTVTILFYLAENILKTMIVIKKKKLKIYFHGNPRKYCFRKIIKTMKDLKNLESLKSIHHKWEFLICFFSSVTISNPNRRKTFSYNNVRSQHISYVQVNSFPDKSASEGTI